MTVLTAISENSLHDALRRAISEAPQPISAVVQRIVGECRVDREEVVAAIWDLVDDEGFVYDAAARIRRA